ncbi:hypothetical protein EDB84DRAFT_1446063 [Lactarius hengduanensis]|nr:hypothetical protein EDB84DRAFT_1446063 [Lactarius hengduanensis]
MGRGNMGMGESNMRRGNMGMGEGNMGREDIGMGEGGGEHGEGGYGEGGGYGKGGYRDGGEEYREDEYEDGGGKHGEGEWGGKCEDRCRECGDGEYRDEEYVVHSVGNPWVTRPLPVPTPTKNPYLGSWVWVPAATGMGTGGPRGYRKPARVGPAVRHVTVPLEQLSTSLHEARSVHSYYLYYLKILLLAPTVIALPRRVTVICRNVAVAIAVVAAVCRL